MAASPVHTVICSILTRHGNPVALEALELERVLTALLGDAARHRHHPAPAGKVQRDVPRSTQRPVRRQRARGQGRRPAGARRCHRHARPTLVPRVGRVNRGLRQNVRQEAVKIVTKGVSGNANPVPKSIAVNYPRFLPPWAECHAASKFHPDCRTSRRCAERAGTRRGPAQLQLRHPAAILTRRAGAGLAAADQTARGAFWA